MPKHSQFTLPTLWRILRAQLGLTQLDVARQIGCSQSYLSLLERGHVVPTAEQARAITQLLKAEIEDLFPQGLRSEAQSGQSELKGASHV